MNSSNNDNSRKTTTPMPCKALRFLYRTKAGRIFLKALISPAPAKLSAVYLNSSLSRPLIKGFIRKNRIDTARYEERKYHSYNDYFTRKQKEGITVFPTDPCVFSAPCDSKLTAYKIHDDSVFYIKDSCYRIQDLLENSALAEQFRDGYCLIYRLSVDDYHRYSYIDDGDTEDTVAIKGVLHTVQPIATERYNIYKRNSREYTLQHSANFGDLVYVEVGAMLIGKICNHHRTACTVRRGEEKGYFEYGGSTVVILCQAGKVKIHTDILENTQNGYETVVRLGDAVGVQIDNG